MLFYVALGAIRDNSIANGNCNMANGGGSGVNVPAIRNDPPMVEFRCPNRPNHGSEGRPILLRANHFQVRMPRGYIHHYDVTIVPDKCPRRVNRY